MKKTLNNLLMAWLAIAMPDAMAADDTCLQSATHSLTITPDQVVRQQAPKALFGFDVPWYDFQQGYFRLGKVRPELINFIKPFEGAYFRYPGGNSFEWQKASGKLGERKKIHEDYAGEQYPEFGPREFLQFLEQVNGEGVFTANLIGSKTDKQSVEAMTQKNLELIRWFSAIPASERIRYWELGNELDWGKFNFTAAQYIERAKPFVKAATAVQPNMKFIVNGRTNPWKFGEAASRDFNEAVAQALPVAGISLHAYYDGYPIPAMTKTINQYASSMKKYSPDAGVFVTEHGRWPTEKPGKRWQENWYQASGGFGAISAADFLLAIIENKNVAAAMWHDLGVRGPWQLIRLNAKTDEIYPSVTYWGLRVLRSGFLQDAVKIEPSQLPGGSYSGGYGVHLVAMSGSEGKLSLLGVNRTDKSISLNVSLNTKREFAFDNMFYIKTSAAGEDNSDAQPQKYTMVSTNLNAAKSPVNTVCIPPHGIFSLLGKL